MFDVKINARDFFELIRNNLFQLKKERRRSRRFTNISTLLTMSMNQ